MPLQLPPLQRARRSLVDEMLERIGRPRALGGVRDTPTMPMEIPRELPPFIEAPVADRLPIGSPLPSKPAQVPLRQTSENLEMRLRESDMPLTQKQTLIQAILSAAPIAAGAAFGGSEGASGAATGVEAYNANQQGLKESRRKTLVEQIQEQKTREQQSSEAALTRDQQATEAGLTRGQQAEEFRVSQEGAAAGRKIQQDTLNETIARDKEAAERARKQPFLVGPDQNALDLETRKLIFTGPKTVPPNSAQQQEIEDPADAKKPLLANFDPQRRITTHPATGEVIPMPRSFLRPPSPFAGLAGIVPYMYSEDGVNKVGLIDKSTAKLRDVETPSGNTANPKFAEPTAEIKKQGTSASTALKQVKNILDIIEKNPQLIGPIVGRWDKYMMGVGENPFIGTKDERIGGQLAEHLNALYAQELRSMFAGRTNEYIQKEIKNTSAQLKQNPNLMKGILDGIAINEGIILDAAKKQGFVEDRAAGAGGATGATGVIELERGPDGKLREKRK